MTSPYGVMSDLHCHAWSQFSSTDATGVNTRLRHILSEMVRCAEEVMAAGGSTIVLAGDLLHTRGSIDPEVLNPVAATIRHLIENGIQFVALPGNHDLKSKETTELGNAFQSLAGDGFQIVTKTDTVLVNGQDVLIVPWFSSLAQLKAELETAAADLAGITETVDVFIHAGIDGVLSGMPAHGLTPEYLAGLGFKRVFAGHYHNHAVFEGGKVVSIGATTHQTYSDIGTKAGFLIVHDDRIVHRASHAPQFVEITADTEEADYHAIVDGNFVRVTGMKLTDRQIGLVRKDLLEAGAAGVSFNVEKVTTVTREGGVVTASGVSLDASVDKFIDTRTWANPEAVKARAAEILSAARSVSSD